MYSEQLTPTSNLQGSKKDGELNGEGKHKASVKPVTFKTVTSSPTLANLTTCTSKSTDSSQHLSTKPSTSKSASSKSGKSTNGDSQSQSILFIHSTCSCMYNLHLGVKRPRCSCEGCSLSDCGVCSNCSDMKKFGGTGRKKQRYMKRKCQLTKTMKVNYMECINLL